MKKVKKCSNGCWLWLGKPNKNGYGRYANRLAHRYIYETKKGPIPEGMVLRHTCHNRLCVSPEHLKIGTKKENYRDMVDAGRAAWQKEADFLYCKRGHLRNEENTYVRPSGRTECAACARYLKKNQPA